MTDNTLGCAYCECYWCWRRARSLNKVRNRISSRTWAYKSWRSIRPKKWKICWKHSSKTESGRRIYTRAYFAEQWERDGVKQTNLFDAGVIFFRATRNFAIWRKLYISLRAQTFGRHQIYKIVYESNGIHTKFRHMEMLRGVAREGKKSKQGARRGRMMEERRNSCVAAGFPLHGAFFKTRHAGDAHSCWSGSCRREPDLHGGCLRVSMDGGIHPRTPTAPPTLLYIPEYLNDWCDRREKMNRTARTLSMAIECVKREKNLPWALIKNACARSLYTRFMYEE